MTIYNHFYIYKEFWVADNRDQTQTLINKDNCKISIVLMAESIYSIQYLNIRVVSRFLKEVKGHLLALIGSRTKSLWGSIWPKKKKKRERMVLSVDRLYNFNFTMYNELIANFCFGNWMQPSTSVLKALDIWFFSSVCVIPLPR